VRTDAIVPVARSLPSRGLSRLIRAGLLIAATLVAWGIGSWTTAAEPASWAPVAPEPADLAIAAAIPHEDLAARTTALVHQGRWSDVVSICETAARKGTLAAALRHQYDLAKLHCDIARRHAEPAYRRQLSLLSETEARRAYGEVLSRISSHHVENPDYGRLSARGRLAVDVALEDPAFVANHASQATAERIAAYRGQVERIVATRPAATQADAEAVATYRPTTSTVATPTTSP
jgi:hypothetical protein